MYPALALATGCYIYHLRRSTALAAGWWPRLAVAVMAVVGAVLLAALPFAAAKHVPGEEWLAAVGLIPLGGAVGCLVLFWRNRIRAATATFTAVSIAFSAAMFIFVAPRVDRHQHNDRLLAAISANSDRPRVAAFGHLEPTWVFYGGRTIRYFGHDRPDRATAFLAGDSSFLITTADLHRRLQEELPQEVAVLAKVPYFLKEGDLVVLGRPADRERTTIAARSRRGLAR